MNIHCLWIDYSYCFFSLQVQSQVSSLISGLDQQRVTMNQLQEMVNQQQATIQELQMTVDNQKMILDHQNKTMNSARGGTIYFGLINLYIHSFVETCFTSQLKCKEACGI